ncbi:tyrosine-type recombinase/integrase [Halobacillus litoralis]|uniref:tyrosine-type recombinase/integrase n=1 Tax=Halobacillus litoralis TaxID=45668 RepID=UPI0024907B59|nr:tyrosine-type recombinase/integrase [Halobacillus litoralis]
MRKVDVFFDEIQVLIEQTKCEILREELSAFFQKHIHDFSMHIGGRHVAFYFLTINLKNVSILEINWESCVRLHNLVIYEELMRKQKVLPSSLKRVITQYYNVYKTKGISNGLFSYQLLINDFYREVYKHLKHKFRNIQNIELYEMNLVSNYFQHDKKRFIDYKGEDLFSALINYPLDCDYTKLIKIPVKNGSRNYWVNTDSTFIRTWVEDYLFNYAIKYLEPVLFRLVGYFFTDSVNKYKYQVNSYQTVDNVFLKHQIEYFQKIPGAIIQRISPSKPNAFFNQLVILYRSLLDTIHVEQGEIGLSGEYVSLVQYEEATTAIKGGYTPIYFNPYESVPRLEKIVFLANEYTRKGANSKNFDLTFLDLSNFPEQIREDILEYIWYGAGTFYQKQKHNHIVKDFYNYLKRNSGKAGQNFEVKNAINHKTLFKYRQKLEFKYTNTATLKGALKTIRSVLKYYGDKYGVSNSMLKVLNLNKLEKINGGTPITDNDLKVIYNEFKKGSDKNKLSLLVFEIFILTNLRIGEILNLERNCIEYKDPAGKANIRYLSKTSNGEYTNQLVSEKVTYLLEEAIRLTDLTATCNSSLSKYIFIEPTQRKINHKLKIVNFTYVFKNVLAKIEDKLANKSYTVNNLRHTYINNVYEQGTKLDYSLPKLAAITNNGYKTAKMYYRKYNEIELYVEALSGVTLTNVDINGEIRNESKTESKNNVKSNLGQCKENSCVFEAMECLICPHFVTFTNRIPKFESKIMELNNTIKSTSNPIIIDEAVSQKKLLSQYLKNMIVLEENEDGASET